MSRVFLFACAMGDASVSRERLPSYTGEQLIELERQQAFPTVSKLHSTEKRLSIPVDSAAV